MENKKINDLQEKIKNLNSEIKNLNKALVEEFFDGIKDFKGLYKLKIHGYTPSFNDGDPCVHNQNLEEINDEDVWSSEFEFSDELSSLVDSMEEPLAQAYGTNWELNITIEDGKVKIDQEDYYCGY